MLKLKWFILGSLCSNLAVAEDVKCKDEFVKEPSLLQTNSELSQQTPRLKNQVQTSSHRWMSFEEAKAFIRNEGIQTSIAFKKWSREGKRPRDFPATPHRTYKEEWHGWGDFLGTGNMVHGKKEFMSFEEAKTFIRNEGIQTSRAFKAWSRSGKRPDNFPSAPDRTYKEEWTGWGDFLGTGRKWMSFEEAQTFIRNEGIQTKREFEEWSRSGKRPEDFPSAPHQTYKEEWTGWGDFLGTGRKWMSFEEAKDFIRSEGIQTRTEFKVWSREGKRPEDFPSAPHRTYKEEWTGWGDFLGTGRKWMSFEEAKDFIRSEGIQTSTEFGKWSREGKRPRDFPSAPEQTYKEEWPGWEVFLGTERQWMSFEEAKAFIQNEGVQTSMEFEEWKQAGKRPDNFPSAPHRTYKEEWTGWGDFLGTGNTISYMKYKNAKKYIQTLGFDQPRDFIEWLRSSDRSIHFPPNPHQFYSEWISVKDFLSTEKYISYKEAKTFVQSLAITNPRDFLELMKDEPDIFPDNFPSNPKVFYSKKGDWIDWNDFLGITGQSKNKTDDRRILNTEDNFQSEEVEEDDFVDEINLQYADMY